LAGAGAALGLEASDGTAGFAPLKRGVMTGES